MIKQISQMDVARQMSDRKLGLDMVGGEWHIVWTVMDVSESNVPYEIFDRLVIQTDERPNRDGKLLAESISRGMAVYSEGEYAYEWMARRAFDVLENGVA